MPASKADPGFPAGSRPPSRRESLTGTAGGPPRRVTAAAPQRAPGRRRLLGLRAGRTAPRARAGNRRARAAALAAVLAVLGLAVLAAGMPPAPAALAAALSQAAGGPLSGCGIATAGSLPREGILQDPARPSTAGWAVTASWGGDVNGGLCLEQVRMYVHDAPGPTRRTWEVTADGRVVASAVFTPGPGYHFWTFSPDVRLGMVRALCAAVTVPRSRRAAGALAARSCVDIGWLA